MNFTSIKKNSSFFLCPGKWDFLNIQTTFYGPLRISTQVSQASRDCPGHSRRETLDSCLAHCGSFLQTSCLPWIVYRLKTKTILHDILWPLDVTRVQSVLWLEKLHPSSSSLLREVPLQSASVSASRAPKLAMCGPLKMS